MKYSEAKPGRVFVIRLEHGDIVHDCIERFASEHSVRAASLIIIGGANTGSKLVVGPEDGLASPVVPMINLLENVHEVAGVGTIFPDESGNPILHMHMAAGRENATVTGCIREGVKVWQVMEVILFELTDSSGVRKYETATGFKLLNPG